MNNKINVNDIDIENINDVDALPSSNNVNVVSNNLANNVANNNVNSLNNVLNNNVIDNIVDIVGIMLLLKLIH